MTRGHSKKGQQECLMKQGGLEKTKLMFELADNEAVHYLFRKDSRLNQLIVQ